MAVSSLVTGLVLALATFPAQVADVPAVSDTVNLRDGAVLLGMITGVDRRGELGVVVRRAWAEEELPESVRGWARTEAEQVRLAQLERRERLQAWRRERTGGTSGDPVPPWIEREIARMADTRPPRTVLMRVGLPRAEIVSVVKREPQIARLLRLGWLAGVGEVETMAPEPLIRAIARRGGARADDPAALDVLLPLASEPDAVWLKRRAATEAVVEDNLRFVQFREFILPEMGPLDDRPQANTTELLDSPAAEEAYRAMLRVTPGDPVRLRLELAARRGRVGAIVSHIQFAADLTSADAESALWIRQESGNWGPAFTRRATVHTDDPPDRPGDPPPAVNVPIRTVLNVVELYAAAPAPPEIAQARQAAAAASQRALGRARALLDKDLAPFVLPVNTRR